MATITVERAHKISPGGRFEDKASQRQLEAKKKNNNKTLSFGIFFFVFLLSF